MLELILVLVSILLSALVKNLVDIIVKRHAGELGKNRTFKNMVLLALPGMLCSVAFKIAFQIVIFML